MPGPSFTSGFAPRDGTPRYPQLWRGCVGAWAPFLGPTGVALRDWGPYRLNGTLTNMEVGSDWVISGGQYALDFGTDDYVSLPYLFIEMPFSVSLWAMSRSVTTNQAIFSIANGSTNDPFFVINFRGDFVGDPVLAQMRGNNNALNTVTQVGTYVTNTWYHIVVEFVSASSRQIYLNGVAGTEDTTTHTVETLNQMAIGCLLRTTPGSFLDGAVDDLRLYNRLLLPAEKQLLGTRRGIAYELRQQKRYSLQAASFIPAWVRYNQLIGAGPQ